MPSRSIICFVLIALGVLAPAAVRAECGGSPECIAVSIDPAVPPAHGTPLVSAPLAFGNQTIATSSAGQPILVRHVTGPVGSLSTLTAITLSGANAADFSITANTCIIGVPSLPRDVPGCTITVAFNPATLGAKSAQITVSTTAITRTVPLTGTGTGAAPAASPTTLSVERNRPASVDLMPLTSGLNVIGVQITGAPSQGTASVSGFVLTYTPNPNYIGPDSLTYETVSSVPEVPASATVTINVVSRANPADDAAVVGLVSAQTQTARRFSRAQISNYQNRMRSLHRRPDKVTAGGASGLAAGGSDPARTGETSVGDSDPLMLALAGPLTTLFSSGAVDLASAGAGVLPKSGEDFSVWVGGNARFGTREQTSNSNQLRFTTDGITAGIDRRFRQDLVFGLGFGYGHDETDVGLDGTNVESTAYSLAAYGSYQPIPEVYVDALIGYAVTRHDSRRFVASTGTFALAERDGDQLFASLTAGYEYLRQGVLLSPYARFDFAHNTLDPATETGAGSESITFLERTFSSYQLALGLRAESTHAMRFGWVRPSAYVEYRHDFDDDDPATLVYADQPGGPIFSVAPSGTEGDALHLGLGNDFVFRNGATLGISYDVELLSSLESSQGLWFWLSKEFDGKRPAPPPSASSLFKNPIQVEAGYWWDDNLNRAREPDKLYDHTYSLNVNQGATFPLSRHTRLAARWFLEGTKLHTYSGLDRFSGGVQGKFQYRPSGSFSAPTFGIFGRAALDEYDSGPRDGYRYSFGVEARKSLTDRIHVYASLARNARNANAAVFDGHDYSGRLRIDYSLGRNGTFNIGGEYRRGDTVSSASGPLTANSMPDNAYHGRALFASNYEARTALFTLGYNWPLGRRDSIDLSWTRAHSEPTGGQSFLASGPYGGAGGGSRSYTADRYSIFYLMRF